MVGVVVVVVVVGGVGMGGALLFLACQGVVVLWRGVVMGGAMVWVWVGTPVKIFVEIGEYICNGLSGTL